MDNMVFLTNSLLVGILFGICNDWVKFRCRMSRLNGLRMIFVDLDLQSIEWHSQAVNVEFYCSHECHTCVCAEMVGHMFLANRPFCTSPPLQSVPRPIGEGLSIAFWASRLSEKLFSRKLTLSNFKLSLELKKKTPEMTGTSKNFPAKLRFGT